MDHDHNYGELENPDRGERPVGYRNPPMHTRWEKGYCPNPNGRPRRAKGRKPILKRISGELVDVKIGSKIERITRVEVVLIAVRTATANGNAAAQSLFDKLLNELHDEQPQEPKGVLILREKLTIDEWVALYGEPIRI